MLRSKGSEGEGALEDADANIDILEADAVGHAKIMSQ